MTSRTDYIWMNTPTHREYVNITPSVAETVEKSGIREGMVLVSAMHITAGVFVNDDEPGILQDIDAWLERLAPFKRDYLHHRTGETNGDSHLKNLLISKGKLDMGPWQQVFYAEFDGQRRKRIVIKAMGE